MTHRETDSKPGILPGPVPAEQLLEQLQLEQTELAGDEPWLSTEPPSDLGS